MSINRLHNSVAVITGAGSGIGRALSLQLAERGANLAISDIDNDTLLQTRELLQAYPVKVHTMRLDVSDEAAFNDYAQTCKAEFGQVNVLINNAGYALHSGRLWETSSTDFKSLMDVNFYGVLHGSKAFLPILHEADWGHIVNISSLFGLISVIGQSAYNSSKFAVRGLTEALRHELKLANSTVSCTSVHPGGIKTNIARSARISDSIMEQEGKDAETIRQESAQMFEQLARTTAEQAAQKIIKALEKDKMRVLIGADAWITDKLQRLLPQHYFTVMTKLFGLRTD